MIGISGSTTQGLFMPEWEQVLGFTGLTIGLSEGLITLDHAYELISEAQQKYPNIPMDFLKAIEAFEDLLLSFEDAINEQNNSLDEFQATLADLDIEFNWDQGRLLNDLERDSIKSLQKELEDAAEDAKDAARDADYAISDAETAIGDIEDAISDMEDQIAEVEDAYAEMEQDMDELESARDEMDG